MTRKSFLLCSTALPAALVPEPRPEPCWLDELDARFLYGVDWRHRQ